MKGNPMKRNFGKHIPKYGTNIPGINNKSEGNTDLPDGRSASSPFQKVTDPTIKELQRTLKKGKYVKGPRKGEEVSDRDRISLEEQLRDLKQSKDDPGSKYHPAYDKEGSGKRSGARRDAKKSPAKGLMDKLKAGVKGPSAGRGAAIGMALGGPLGAAIGGLAGRIRKKRQEKKGAVESGVAGGAPAPTAKRGKAPTKHNLPGIRHTKPKKHGEYKKAHIHGADPRNPDPTNKKRPTKVKGKVYRKSK